MKGILYNIQVIVIVITITYAAKGAIYCIIIKVGSEVSKVNQLCGPTVCIFSPQLLCNVGLQCVLVSRETSAYLANL